MPRKKKTKAKSNETLEQKLWKTADKLRKNIDAAEYKHIVLGLIFLKYISDAFAQLHEKLVTREGQYEGGARGQCCRLKLNHPGKRTCWGKCTSTSWDSSPSPKVARGDSSIRPRA